MSQPAIKVRLGTLDDVPAIVALGAVMHAESPRFSRFPYSPEKVADVVATMLCNPKNVVIVADHSDQGIVGMFGGFIAEHYFSTAKYASDVAMFIHPDHRGGSVVVRVLKTFEEWAISQGAIEIAPGISTEVQADRTLQLYSRLGYRLSGHLTVKYV